MSFNNFVCVNNDQNIFVTPESLLVPLCTQCSLLLQLLYGFCGHRPILAVLELYLNGIILVWLFPLDIVDILCSCLNQ